MLHRALAYLLLCLCALSSASHAAPARTLRFEQLSVEHGLAQESVLATVQDSDGYMWFGTQGGLSRFDGYKVTTYRNVAGDPESLVNNWVRVLHVDRRGQLWVGTDGGLERWDPATQSFIHYAPHEPARRGNGNRHVRAIAPDGKDGLWIGTSDGLQHFDMRTGRFRYWHQVPGDAGSLIDNQVNAVAVDASGCVWIGTASGLDSLAPGAATFNHHPAAGPNLRYNVVHALLVDSSQTLWIGSMAGLETWKVGSLADQRQRLGAQDGFAADHVTVLYQDPDAAIWAGTHVNGLYRWEESSRRFSNFRHLQGDKYSVADNFISSLYRDRVGTFWVGTWYAGASRVDLNSGGFARIVRMSDIPGALSDNKIRAIAEDGQGKLWLAANSGLNHYDPHTGLATVYRHQPGVAGSLAGPTATALARDASGALWVGTQAGVSRFDPASGQFSNRVFNGGDPDSNNIRGILSDSAGMLWIASRGGLHRFDPVSGRATTYRHYALEPGSLADNVVRPLLEDRHGRLWIGTFNGLDLFDRESGRFRHFRHDPADPLSISSDEVHYLMEDRNGSVWVGTAAGLNRMTIDARGNARFVRYTMRDGLADDGVAAMLEDADGTLWISTNSGISRLEPRTGRWRNYRADDGTIEGAYFDGAALRAADGFLYFGGFNGVTAFNPREISDNLIAPRAVISGIQIFNRPVELARPELLAGPVDRASSITFEAADSMFSIEFAALHFAAPHRNLFSYKLEGFDQNWVNTDASKRFATYTNLDPGTYTFRVRAANKDGVWGARDAQLQVVILPPWWKTWWLRTLVALVVLSGGAAAYRARLSSLRRQKRQLEQQVRQRTLEIAQQNRMLERQKSELEAQREDADNQRAEAERRRADAERQKEEVERQKVNVELAHRNISVLSEIGRELTATLDMETIMQTVYRHVHHLMDARIFGIGFYQHEQGVVEFPFSMDQGVRNDVYWRSLADPNQFAVWCLHNRREVFLNDVDAEYENYLATWQGAPPGDVRRVDGTPCSEPKAAMYVPLIVKDRMMGVLCVQSTEKHAYRRVHLDMLQTLAAHAAVALDNARAYRELEETQARLVEQERQVRHNTEELAQANRALQENEERLRLAKQKAEDATRQKSEFLANMSHEMRTPLAGVLGMLGFAVRDQQLGGNTRQQLVRAQSNAQSLLTLINDLLDFSKIEAGKLTIENIDFALGTMVDNVAALFEEQAAAHSVDFSVELSEQLPPFVVGDPTRLRQVLVNLVGNAFKFTNEGAVTVKVELAGRRGHLNLISFAVVDTGIGIAPEAIERLFQKFEQADSTTTRRYGGTGLGLAICRQLVDLMDGTISVHSREGQGSSFTVVLPLPDGVAPPVVPHVPREPHSHRLRVLCAEDFPTNQIIIRMMLEELGHEVEIVENGLLAVAACARTRYDLILMDGRMPEMDGASATRLIRAGGLMATPVRDQELMIIALTANASEEDRDRYLACGMDDFLTKPIDEAALHYQLSRAIERQLQRGIALPRMQAPAPALSTGDLDAMFGVFTDAPSEPQRSASQRNEQLKERMRAAFATDVPLRRADLDGAIAARDVETAARLLHGMKGSAAYLDALELHQLCGDLEKAADAGDWARIGAAMPQLGRLLDQFETAPGSMVQ